MIEGLDRLEFRGTTLSLQRAWPRSCDHLHLEYQDQAGRLTAAQWHRDPAELERIARQTARACPDRPGSIEGGVYFHDAGGDRRLALRPLLDLPGATLLSHRPERRAVVRLAGAGGTARYAKAHKPGAEATSVEAVAGIRARRPPFALAEVLEHDAARGLVIWSELPGRSLHELLGDQRLVPGAAEAGAILAFLHGGVAPVSMPAHGPEAEAQLLEKCLADLTVFAPEAAATVRPRLPAVLAALRASCGISRPLHRDFYDKQVLITDSGPPTAGLLDLDTGATGEPALDVANFLAHLDLRVLQGRCPAGLASAAAGAFLDGYGRPPAAARIDAYRAAARLRLSCLYAFRPRWRHVVQGLTAVIPGPRPPAGSRGH